MSLLTNRKLLECLCAVIETWMTSFQPVKMPSENTRRSRGFSGILPVKMASWMFLSQHRNMKAIFYLFYNITKVFWVVVTSSMSPTLIQNENDVSRVYIQREDDARPIRVCVGRLLLIKLLMSLVFSQNIETRLASFSFYIRVQRQGWRHENSKKPWLFYRTNRK